MNQSRKYAGNALWHAAFRNQTRLNTNFLSTKFWSTMLHFVVSHTCTSDQLIILLLQQKYTFNTTRLLNINKCSKRRTGKRDGRNPQKISPPQNNHIISITDVTFSFIYMLSEYLILFILYLLHDTNNTTCLFYKH